MIVLLLSILLSYCDSTPICLINNLFKIKIESKSELHQIKNEPKSESARMRTLSNSSSAEPMVNVQKLESMAPEFQTLTDTMRRGVQPSSILVDKV